MSAAIIPVKSVGEPSILGGKDLANPSTIFQGTRCYPVQLSDASLSQATIVRYTRWQQALRWPFDPAEQPWLPVGQVGPLLILGHYDPSVIRPPLLQGAFQPVLLSYDDYERHLKLCTPVLRSQETIDWQTGDARAPRCATMPSAWVRPNAISGALQWMLEYCPNSTADYDVLTGLLDRVEFGPDDLPTGYYAAAWFLMQRGAVADLTAIRVSERTRSHVPVELRGMIYPVSEASQSLWVAASKLPQTAAQDMLLNALGDEWSVHFLLIDGGREIQASASESSESRRPSAAAAQKIVIEQKVDAKHAAKGWTSGASGDIEITERERAELTRYDPRRADRDPVKVFRKFIVQALEQGASDLHIEPGVDHTTVRGRVDGLLEIWLEAPSAFGQQLIGAASDMTGIRKDKHEPEDQKCKVRMGTSEVNVRVSAIPVRAVDRKLVLRFLPKRGEAPPLNTIMPERELRYLKAALEAPNGMILLCGPTGSGKTTTIASSITQINTPDRNILTLEDPVEIEMTGVNQCEIDEARNVGWAELMKSFLRQDPDSGLLGEVRDRESAEAAIRLTLTGHLVFATLHTISCAETMERLLDMGVNPNMLSSALTLVVSQRLVRRLCTKPGCRRARALLPDEAAVYVAHGLPVPERVFSPVDCGTAGCNCRSGYKGRVAAVEILPCTPAVKDMIMAHRPAKDFQAWMRRKQLYTVHEAALLLAANGVTSFEEANEWREVWEQFPELLEDAITPEQIEDSK